MTARLVALAPQAAQEEGGDNIFLLPNATFWAELLIFLAILFVIWRYAMPPVRKAMQERQEMVRRQIEESRQARERLEQADAKYGEAMAEARTEAAKIRDEARAEAGRIKAELREQADREIQAIRQRADEQLAQQREQVKRELQAELGRLAVTLAERIVGESMADEERRRGTVDRFIAELEGMATEEPEQAEQPAKAGRGGRRKA